MHSDLVNVQQMAQVKEHYAKSHVQLPTSEVCMHGVQCMMYVHLQITSENSVLIRFCAEIVAKLRYRCRHLPVCSVLSSCTVFDPSTLHASIYSCRHNKLLLWCAICQYSSGCLLLSLFFVGGVTAWVHVLLPWQPNLRAIPIPAALQYLLQLVFLEFQLSHKRIFQLPCKGACNVSDIIDANNMTNIEVVGTNYLMVSVQDT